MLDDDIERAYKVVSDAFLSLYNKEQSQDLICKYSKDISEGVSEMIKDRNVYVKEFLLQDLVQDLKPDDQRLEIEHVARVIVTPVCVEVYTFDDHVYTIELGKLICSKNYLGDIQ